MRVAALICFALFGMAAAQTKPDSSNVRIYGRVMDGCGGSISNVAVTAVPDGATETPAVAETDQNGNYALAVKSGRYALRAEGIGRNSATRTVIATETPLIVPPLVLVLGGIECGPAIVPYDPSPVSTPLGPARADKLKALIIDGQNNHHWQETTPVLKKILEDSGLFVVTVATAPPGPDMSAFHPDFAAYDVIVSNYNGLAWPDETKAAFEKYVRDGGGFVSYHAADNAFPDWPAYNEMIGVGGWAGRNTSLKAPSGLFLRNGKTVAFGKFAMCGHHGDRLPFRVTVRDIESPIARGLPAVWMHAADELYDSLCGPAKDIDVVATAHSDPANKGTGDDEPMLMTLRYGKGRVFHTTLGHDVAAMQSVDFIVTFARGAEWAATGKVTQKVPDDFPTADHVSLRK